jgi:thioredoxin reductase (NADPH)
VHLGEDVRGLERVEVDGEDLWRLTTDKGGDYLTRTLIITAGHGAFEPRTLPIPGLEAWRGRGLHYFVTRKAEFEGCRCVIVGGGDSALDWTVNLQDTASGPIHLVHRRDRFRGLESSQTEVRRLADEGRARILTPYEVRAIHGVERIEAVDIEHADTGEIERVDCDALILQLGFISRLGAIAEWGLEVVGKKQVRVDPTTFETALHGVFAAGDVAYYDGKITLITIGLGEAAIAANQCVARVRGVKVQPAYSTEYRYFFFAGAFFLCGPSDTVTVTLVAFGTVRPAFGACALMSYFFTLPDVSWTIEPSTQPALRKLSRAWGIVIPSVRGTTHGSVRLVCTAAAAVVTSAVDVPQT